MSVLDELLQDAQAGYETQTREVLIRLLDLLGDAAFMGVEKADFISRTLDAVSGPATPDQSRLQVVSDLSTLSWWTGLPIADAEHGRLAALARSVFLTQVRAVDARAVRPDPAARAAHAVFTAPFVDNPMHSPTRGAFDYVRALATDPDCRSVEVFHGGAIGERIAAYARETLGPYVAKVRFIATDRQPDFLADAVGQGPRTFHIWCDAPLNINISLVALFGPTLMFTCGDAVPVQYADLYWYAHEPAYMEDLWRRRGAPERFIANYRQLEASPFPPPRPAKRRTRVDLGFHEDEVVIATVGNRLGVDMDQAFVDGVAGLVLANPNLRWLIVGGLQDYWVGAFQQVLGERFTHIAHDDDLPSLMALADVFANPFRAGGGNTAILAVDAGCLVLTRGDMGDVGAFIPASHRAADAEAYFRALRDLVADPTLRAARLAEQQALLAVRCDQERFAAELKEAVALAWDRFAARTPGRVEPLFGVESKLSALKGGPQRLGRSGRSRPAPRR